MCLKSSTQLCNLCRQTLAVGWQHSLQSSKLPLEAMAAQELFVEGVMKWVSMAEQPHTSLRSLCAVPRISCSGVKLTAIGLWRSGNPFSGVLNIRFTIWQSGVRIWVLTDSRSTLPAPMHSANCKVWWMRNNGLGLFFMVWAGPLSSSEGNS